jgi:hypothetical protein
MFHYSGHLVNLSHFFWCQCTRRNKKVSKLSSGTVRRAIRIFSFSLLQNRHNWYAELKGITRDECIVNRFSSLCSSLLIDGAIFTYGAIRQMALTHVHILFTGVVCTRFAGASSLGMSVRSFSNLASRDERIVLYGCICTQDGT